MSSEYPYRGVVVERHPIHAALAPFPVACFTLTLFTDIAYWRTSNLLWQHFSEWLLLAGLVIGGLSALVGAIVFLTRWRRYDEPPAWLYALGTVIALLLAFINSLIHAGDGWTAVVPNGLILSAVTVVVLILTGWFGRSTVQRRVVGVTSHE